MPISLRRSKAASTPQWQNREATKETIGGNIFCLFIYGKNLPPLVLNQTGWLSVR
jgi:hypothetical protein